MTHFHSYIIQNQEIDKIVQLGNTYQKGIQHWYQQILFGIGILTDAWDATLGITVFKLFIWGGISSCLC